jgi:ABC-type phosphate/phosphonate transport system ATPase subunit
VAIGTDTTTSESVRLRYVDCTIGAAIIGKSGTGKSSILEHLILADLAAGRAGMVIDPHGKLVHHNVASASPFLPG